MVAKRKPDPLEHLKKPTRIAHPEKARDQKIIERKNKGREVSKAKRGVK
jgi:hypothetical protein